MFLYSFLNSRVSLKYRWQKHYTFFVGHFEQGNVLKILEGTLANVATSGL